MPDIVDLDAHRPHAVGPALCFRCWHEWVAVRPLGNMFLECPKCAASRGYTFANVLGSVEREFGQECCGQKDGYGICAAPACIRGQTVNFARGIVRLAQMEYSDGDRQTESYDDSASDLAPDKTLDHGLTEAIEEARRQHDALTPEEEAARDKAQIESLAKGLTATGDPRLD